jgi:hypothetical protein
VVTTHSRHALVVAEEAGEAMPALLSEWGYDAALWSQIRSKRILMEWAQDGGAEAEVKAKERLATIRQMTSAEAAPMPAFLAQCGCDEALWSNIRSKASLVRLAEGGDEAAVKARLDEIREAIANPKPSGPPPAAPGAPKVYRRDGPASADVDEAKVGQLLTERAQAKRSKDYAAADVLQEQLRTMGVDIFDRRGTWKVHVAGGPPARGPGPGAAAKRKPAAAGPPPTMPAQLGEWGCDAALWDAIHSKQALVKLLEAGNMEYAKQRFERMRELVAASNAKE